MTTSTITQGTSSNRTSVSSPHGAATRVRAAVVAAAGFMVLAAFQLALALGAPWGEAAYGGTRTDLPTGLRTASAVATIVYILAALVVLRRGGYRVPLISVRIARIGTWVLVGLMAVGTIANFASAGEWERFGWGPFTLLLAALCFVVARKRADTVAE
jgi:hypothetical protein